MEEPLDLGVDASVFSLALGSLAGAGAGKGSWITLRSSLLCWPRCSLAKSKPFTLGVCSWGDRGREKFMCMDGNNRELQRRKGGEKETMGPERAGKNRKATKTSQALKQNLVRL